jgi:hypothetical protein
VKIVKRGDEWKLEPFTPDDLMRKWNAVDSIPRVDRGNNGRGIRDMERLWWVAKWEGPETRQLADVRTPHGGPFDRRRSRSCRKSGTARGKFGRHQ